MENHEQHCAMGDVDLCRIAVAAGILPSGSKMTPELLEYTRRIAAHAAAVVEHWTDEEHSAADEIRATFGLG
jgi:hypothetical protein